MVGWVRRHSIPRRRFLNQILTFRYVTELISPLGPDRAAAARGLCSRSMPHEHPAMLTADRGGWSRFCTPWRGFAPSASSDPAAQRCAAHPCTECTLFALTSRVQNLAKGCKTSTNHHKTLSHPPCSSGEPSINTNRVRPPCARRAVSACLSLRALRCPVAR